MVVTKEGNMYYLNGNRIKNSPGLHRSHTVPLPNGTVSNSTAFHSNRNSPLMVLEYFNGNGRIQRHYGVIMNNTSRLVLLSNNDKTNLMKHIKNTKVRKVQAIRKGSVLRKTISKYPRTVMRGYNRQLNKKIKSIPANLPPNFMESLKHILANNTMKRAKKVGESLSRR